MSNTNTNTNPVAPAPVAPAAEEAKVSTKIELPTITEFAELPVVISEKVAILTVNDGETYSQINSAVKEMSGAKLVSSAKEGVLTIHASEKNTAALVKFINPALADADVVIINITYGDYPKMRISAKNAGTSKAKASNKSTFFDRSLEGMIDEGDYNYIYGVDGTDYTKELNTKIVRVVKSLYPGKLYSDDHKGDVRGFHKANTKIVANDLGLRSTDNYSFFFKWDKISALLGEVEGPKCIATIVAIFKEVYPDLVIDTTKDLYVEATKSEFNAISKLKLVWDEEENKIVSKAEIIAKEKEAKKLEKEAKKEADKAEKAAAKAAKKKAESEDVKGEEVAPAVAPTAPAVGGMAAKPVTPAVGGMVAKPATPAAPVAPVTPVTPVAKAADLISGTAVPKA